MWNTGRQAVVRATSLGVVANLAFVALAAGSQAGPGYLAVDDWDATGQGANAVRLSVATSGNIPKQPDTFIDGHAIVGFAWLDAGSGRALVATIHPVIGRDSNQRPASWHLHTVTLGLVDPDGDDDPVSTDDACVVSIDSTPTAGINVQGDSLSVNLDRSSMPAGVGPEDIDLATGFTVHPNGACGSGLGVRVRT